MYVFGGYNDTNLLNDMYIFGGYNDNKLLNDLWEYNPENNTWEEKTPITKPSPRYDHSVCEINNKMYVFGGYGDGYLNDLWEYNPEKNTWEEKTQNTKPKNEGDKMDTITINNQEYKIGDYVFVEEIKNDYLYSDNQEIQKNSDLKTKISKKCIYGIKEQFGHITIKVLNTGDKSIFFKSISPKQIKGIFTPKRRVKEMNSKFNSKTDNE